MKKIKKIFSNAWVVGILGSIIATIILSGITAMYQKIDIIQALKQVFYWVLSVFTYKVPIYVIILVIIGLFIIAEVLNAVNTSKSNSVNTSKTNNKPKFTNYTKDNYKKWLFIWDYYRDSNYQYCMKNLQPICKCGCSLSYKDSFGSGYYPDGLLVCPKCETTYPYIDNETVEDFKKIVAHNIKTENYPQDL